MLDKSIKAATTQRSISVKSATILQVKRTRMNCVLLSELISDMVLLLDVSGMYKADVNLLV